MFLVLLVQQHPPAIQTPLQGVGDTSLGLGPPQALQVGLTPSLEGVGMCPHTERSPNPSLWGQGMLELGTLSQVNSLSKKRLKYLLKLENRGTKTSLCV